WDHGDLHPLTKTNPIQATGAHISIIGHITADELRRHLTEAEMGNGFANRFLWIAVRRSKEIPNPTGVPDEILAPLIERLTGVLLFAQSVGELVRTDTAERLWAGVYPVLSECKPRLGGAVFDPAEAQVMRVACLYALLDLSARVLTRHLTAAMALWRYVEASARWVFGTNVGNAIADRILAAVRGNGPLSETQIRDIFGRNRLAS